MTAIAPATVSASPVAVADAESMVAAAFMEIQDVQLLGSKSRVEAHSGDRNAALERARRQLHDAMKKRDEGGWFSKVAHKFGSAAQVASLVAACAAAGTGVGAPAAVALIAAGCTVASYGMKETGLDGKAFELEIGGKTLSFQWSDVVAFAGIAAGSGAGLAAGAEGTSAGASGLAKASRVVHLGAVGVQAGATSGQAVYTYKAGDAKADAVEYQADARESESRAERAKSDAENQVDVIRSVIDSRRKVIEALAAILEEKGRMGQKLAGARA